PDREETDPHESTSSMVALRFARSTRGCQRPSREEDPLRARRRAELLHRRSSFPALHCHALNRVAKKRFSAAAGSVSSNQTKLPRSASTRAACMKPPHAARASAEATDTRRTPSAASTATEPWFADAITFTGFGETAATTAEMASGSSAPGAKSTSAPASANAASRRQASCSGSG